MMKFKRMLVRVLQDIFLAIGVIEVLILWPIAITGSVLVYAAITIIEKVAKKLK